ncbi:MAG: beta-lactamase family protein [Bacteroidetes bacterium]|nr:beta-lactamase family protein [Bacteroidota bacterium]
MKKLLKIYIPGFLLLIILFLFLQPNPYFRRAIIYNTVDIDDYQLFKNREVKTGTPQPWEISPNYNQYEISTKDSALLAQYETVAFLVIKDTSIVFESYWEGYSEDAISSSFSMAKSVVGLLVGIALDEGKISSVQDPIARYLPEFKDAKYTITVKDLLTMSSGIQWNESYNNPFSVTTKSYYGNNIDKLILKSKSTQEPGKKYHYKVTDPQLLSIILKRVYKQTLSEITSEKLWKPLGAENAASWSLDQEEGDEKATCCFNSNARDFARLGQLILNKGEWNNKQIVSQEYLQEALMPAFYLTDEDNNPVDYYGYQWWICNYKNSMVYYARGILGQYIIAIPEYNLVVVRLGHQRSKEKTDHHPADLFGYLDLALKIANK